MNNNRATLEVIAPTVDEAIEKGLSELGLPQDSVDVEVLDTGAHGIFGLGTRQARIRLAVKGSGTEPEEAAPSVTEAAPTVSPVEPEPEKAIAEEDDVLMIARDIVNELLEKMKITAEITTRFGQPEDPKDRVPVLVEIRGDDLSILIGKRAETLNALQYIAGLIIGKELGRSFPLVIDVEGYRSRRTGQLRQLARRMADQVAKTGRRLVLEPMPANERRIIHIELRDHPEVTTESVGEEPHRKVTIIPKE